MTPTDDSPRSVLHVGYLGLGGIRHLVLELIDGLSKVGIDSAVIAYQRNPDERELVNVFQTAVSIEVIGKSSRFDFTGLTRLTKAVYKRRCTVVVHHYPLSALIHSMAWRISRRRSAPPILVHHTAFQHLSRSKRMVETLAAVFVHKNVCVGSNSLPVSNRLYRKFLGKSTILIPNPISRSGASSGASFLRDYSTSTPKINVAMVGRLVPGKDFLTLVRGVSLTNEILERKIHLHIAGDGPDRSNILSVARAELSENFSYHGALSPKDTRLLLESCDIYVQSSEGEADLSTSVLLAMESGIPVICSRWPGIENELKDAIEQPILMFEVGDSPGLSELLLSCLRSPSLQQSLTRAAIAYIESKHEAKGVVSKWIALFEEL